MENEIKINNSTKESGICYSDSQLVDNEKNDLYQFMKKIRKNLVEPTYYDDIRNCIVWKKRWKKIANVTEMIGKIFYGFSVVLAFSAEPFNIGILSFIAGSMGIISFVLHEFSLYATKESKERTDEANKMLDKYNVDQLVDITNIPHP